MIPPTLPTSVDPITLTSCVSKVFTSLVKRRWLAYMVDNGFLNTATQKAFVDDVPGCSEHHLKVLSIIREAQRRWKSLCVCWINLANAFSSVHHDLITFSLAHYHAPPQSDDQTCAQSLQWAVSCGLYRRMDHQPHPPSAGSLPGRLSVGHHLQQHDEHPGGLHHSTLLLPRLQPQLHLL